MMATVSGLRIVGRERVGCSKRSVADSSLSLSSLLPSLSPYQADDDAKSKCARDDDDDDDAADGIGTINSGRALLSDEGGRNYDRFPSSLCRVHYHCRATSSLSPSR